MTLVIGPAFDGLRNDLDECILASVYPVPCETYIAQRRFFQMGEYRTLSNGYTQLTRGATDSFLPRANVSFDRDLFQREKHVR